MKSILAHGRVVMNSRREQPEDGKLLRRIQLSGEELVYVAASNEMKIDGEGMLVAEDYRRPDDRAGKPAGASADATELAGNIDRPSHTLFQWHKLMRFSQSDRRVAMEGDVTMVHRSGRQVDLSGLNVPRYDDLPAGRFTRMTCENLVAKFGPPTRPPATGPAADIMDAGPQLGPLDLFTATGQVNLRDGPWQVLGQRLIYERSRDIVIVWGYLEGEQRRNASISYEDTVKGRSPTVPSPKMIWYRANDRIVTEEVTGGG